MANNIDTAFVKQYHSTIERLLQQMGSKFSPYVRVESQASEEQFWEQLGQVEVRETNERFGDSPVMDQDHQRRRVTLRNFDVGSYIDSFDKVKLLIDPSSTYIQNFKDGFGRAKDIVIIGRDSVAAADIATVQSGFFGNAYTGKAGATVVAFPSANEIADDFSTAGTSSNLTVNKVIEAKRLMLSYFNDPAVEPWYFGYGSSQLAAMLKTTQVTSSDYNSIKALVKGEINSWMGFEWVNSEYLQKSSNDRWLPVWAKSGILLAIGMEVTTDIAKRADKKFNWYAYAKASFGSTRMQENKVLRVLCDETK